MMTRDDVLRMALEAGFPILGPARTDAAMRFAALVAAEERQKNLVAASEACRAFGKSGAVLMAAIRAKVEQ